MSSVLQLINDKLSKTVTITPSSSPSSSSGPVLPCGVRPIPFSVPTSFRLRPTGAFESPSAAAAAAAGRGVCVGSSTDLLLRAPEQAAGPGGRRVGDRDDDEFFGGIAQRTSLSRSLDFRGVLGSLDPRLYRKPDDSDAYDDDDDDDAFADDGPTNGGSGGGSGRICFSVGYERQAEKLLVTVIKARNLGGGGGGGGGGAGGDHFVRVHLLPDERRYMQSKFKKKASNPQFDENFVFQVSSRCIDERVLKLTVYEVDRSKRHLVVGHALYPLKDHDTEERLVVWRSLEREITETSLESGELLVSLSYRSQLERLSVAILQGKGFKKTEDFALPDIYVKMSLLLQGKIVKTKKTDVVRRSVEPSFNESVTFKLSPSDLDSASVSIAAIQSSTHHVRDRVIGRAVLGSYMFARGKELEHWNKMVSAAPEQIIQWHPLT